MKVGKISTVLFNNYSNPEKTNVKQNYHESRQQIKANNPLLNYQQSVSFGMAKMPGLSHADDLFTRFSQSLKKMNGDFAGIVEELCRAEEPVKKTFALLTDEEGQTALHKMFSLSLPDNKEYFEPNGIISQYWEKIIGILSPEEQLRALTIQDKDGDTIGHYAVYNSPEVFKTFMKGIKGFPAAKRVKILELANNAGYTIGHWAAENSPETLEMFMKSLSGLSAAERVKILTAKNKQGYTVIQSLYGKHPEKYDEFAKKIAYDESLSKEETIKLLQELNIDRRLNSLIAKVEQFAE